MDTEFIMYCFYDLHFCVQNWKEMLNDGLHLSRTGAEFLADLVWPHLEKLTQHIPEKLPTWKDIDSKDPEKSLVSNE